MHVWVLETRAKTTEAWSAYFSSEKKGAVRFYRDRLKEKGRQTRVRKYVPQDGGRSVPAGEKP